MNNDLISREALKKAIMEKDNANEETWEQLYDSVLDEIDNAPTVELTEEQAIDKLHETGWLPMHDKEMTERPQGEWNQDEDDNSLTCSGCGCRLWANDIIDGEAYFCPNCGAEMRGGGSDEE